MYFTWRKVKKVLEFYFLKRIFEKSLVPVANVVKANIARPNAVHSVNSMFFCNNISASIERLSFNKIKNNDYLEKK